MDRLIFTRRVAILLGAARVIALITVVAVSGGAALAADPPEVPLLIQQNQFQPAEVKVKAGAPFVLVVTNKDAKAAEFESKELRTEKVVPAGQTVKIRVRAEAGHLPLRQRLPQGNDRPDRRGIAMGATFIVMLREGFEAALLLGIVYSYLNRSPCSHRWARPTTLRSR